MRFQCPRCGQHLECEAEMAGTSVDCPSCHQPFMIPTVAPVAVAAPPQVVRVEQALGGSNKKMSGMAVASLVLGIIGIVGGWFCCGLPCSLVGVILGHISFTRANREPHLYTGRGLAIAGLVTGYVGLVLGIVAGIMLGMGVGIMGSMLEEMNRVFQMPPPNVR